MSKAFSLNSTYVNLRPDDSATTLKNGARFWAGIDKRTDLDSGRLMGKTGQSKDWDHWERHPAGDEILTLLSGEMELVLDMPGGEQRTRLKAGRDLRGAAAASGTAASCASRAADVHHAGRRHRA